MKVPAVAAALAVLLCHSSAVLVVGSEHYTVPPPRLDVAGGPSFGGFDPRKVSGPTEQLVKSLVYETLLKTNREGSLAPLLATSWQVSRDGRSYDFRLRRGILFHDGSELDAEAVVENFVGATSRAYRSSLHSARIDKVEARDSYTVRFTLREPNGAFLTFISDPSAALISPKALVSGVDIDSEPVGTGAFRLKRHLPGEYVSLPAFEGYWGDKPNFSGVVVLPSRDPVDLLRRGVANVAVNVPPGAASILERQGFTVSSERSTVTMWLHLNAGVVQGTSARQAIAYAINRSKLLLEVFGGFADLPENTLVWSAFVPLSKPINLPYDPVRARTLAKESGLAGKPLTVSTDIRLAETANWLQKEIASVLDIRMLVSAWDSPSAVRRDVKERGVALWLNSASFGHAYESSLQAIFLPDGALNWNAYAAPRLAQLTDEAARSARLDEKNKLYEELQRAAITQLTIVVPLARPRWIIAAAPRVQGLRPTILGFPDVTRVLVRL